MLRRFRIIYINYVDNRQHKQVLNKAKLWCKMLNVLSSELSLIYFNNIVKAIDAEDRHELSNIISLLWVKTITCRNCQHFEWIRLLNIAYVKLILLCSICSFELGPPAGYLQRKPEVINAHVDPGHVYYFALSST